MHTDIDAFNLANAKREIAQIAAAPESPVEAALSQIDACMRDLQNATKRIHGRLELVLTEACVNAEAGDQAAPVSSTPLVRRLNAMAAQLRQECSALQDMERRLAL